MSFIKECLKTVGLVSIFATANVYATDITVGSSTLTIGGGTVVVDDRESAGDPDAYGNDDIFNIDQMSISWASDDTITVDIITNFDYTKTGQYSYYGKNIRYGDLLMKVDSSDYNYAFNLNGMRQRGYAFSNDTGGGLFAISGTKSSEQFHTSSYGSSYKKGAIWGYTTGSELGPNNGIANTWSVSSKLISFSFNVSGIHAFQSASSLAFSWAMSCFNDDVSTELTLNRQPPGPDPKPIPEPATLFIMLIALTALVYTRKQKGANFIA